MAEFSNLKNNGEITIIHEYAVNIRKPLKNNIIASILIAIQGRSRSHSNIYDRSRIFFE